MYKLLETYRLNFDFRLAIQLGVMNKWIELSFLVEKLCSISCASVWKLNEDSSLNLKGTDLSQPARCNLESGL